MKQGYKSIFSNAYITVNTEIVDFDVDGSNYISPIVVNGVIMETDGFECLTIDPPKRYSEEQLKQFDYDIVYPYGDKTKEVFMLKNYRLKTFIPVSVLNKDINKWETANLVIEMIHIAGAFMKYDDNRNFENVCLTDSCEDYIARKY